MPLTRVNKQCRICWLFAKFMMHLVQSAVDEWQAKA